MPSRKHTSAELSTLSSVVEVAKSFLRKGADDFIRALDDRALLVEYSGDGTPIASRCSFVVSSGGESVRRAGRGTHEYYVQNCFLVAFDSMGRRCCKVVLEDPRPMTEGKKVASELAFGLSLMPQPRALGHRGIEIFFFELGPSQVRGAQSNLSPVAEP